MDIHFIPWGRNRDNVRNRRGKDPAEAHWQKQQYLLPDRLPCAAGSDDYSSYKVATLLSSHTVGAWGTISDIGTENLLILETTWGVCAAYLSTVDMEKVPLKRSSA